MILRRMIEHVRTQNWTAVALDFFIVVMGVFIGLQANTWKEARGERAEENLLISRLADEFDVIDTRIGIQIDHYYQNMVDTNKVIEFAALEREMDPEELKTSLRRITTRRLPPRRSATFTAMLSSGKIDLVDDSRLLTALIAYDTHADLLAEVFTFNASTVIESEAVVFRTVRFETNPDAATDSTIGPIRSIDADAFRADPSTLNALQAIYGAHENLHALLIAQRANVAELRVLLKEARP